MLHKQVYIVLWKQQFCKQECVIGELYYWTGLLDYWTDLATLVPFLNPLLLLLVVVVVFVVVVVVLFLFPGGWKMGLFLYFCMIIANACYYCLALSLLESSICDLESLVTWNSQKKPTELVGLFIRFN